MLSCLYCLQLLVHNFLYMLIIFMDFYLLCSEMLEFNNLYWVSYNSD